ncbi:hypothetical protein IW262DRAFT_1461769 [Armillaria fumosa]|nr:hypothetical protein IW262DRAFT_1461769 [Armillaria fumosa]
MDEEWNAASHPLERQGEEEEDNVVENLHFGVSGAPEEQCRPNLLVGCEGCDKMIRVSNRLVDRRIRPCGMLAGHHDSVNWAASENYDHAHRVWTPGCISLLVLDTNLSVWDAEIGIYIAAQLNRNLGERQITIT